MASDLLCQKHCECRLSGMYCLVTAAYIVDDSIQIQLASGNLLTGDYEPYLDECVTVFIPM